MELEREPIENCNLLINASFAKFKYELSSSLYKVTSKNKPKGHQFKIMIFKKKWTNL